MINLIMLRMHVLFTNQTRAPYAEAMFVHLWHSISS